MTPAELDRAARRAGLRIPKETPVPVIPDPLNPDPDEANCTCGAPDVAHCDGCLACPGDAHDEACGW